MVKKWRDLQIRDKKVTTWITWSMILQGTHLFKNAPLKFRPFFPKHFRYLKWRVSWALCSAILEVGFPLHKPYPYCLYRFSYLHFRYLKCLVTFFKANPRHPGIPSRWRTSTKLGSWIFVLKMHRKKRLKWDYTNIWCSVAHPPPPVDGSWSPPPLWLWGCGGALLVSDAADFLWFLVPPPPCGCVDGSWWWWRCWKYVYKYLCVYEYIYMYMYMMKWICTYNHMYIYVYIYTYVIMFMNMYVYGYVSSPPPVVWVMGAWWWW